MVIESNGKYMMFQKEHQLSIVYDLFITMKGIFILHDISKSLKTYKSSSILDAYITMERTFAPVKVKCMGTV